MGNSFRGLLVWQRAMQLAVAIYRLTRDFPRGELYGLMNQAMRSAVSISSNIAERQGRLSTGEFKQFLGIARGSNFELQTQIETALSLKMGYPKLLDEADGLSHEVGKMLYGMLESLKTSKCLSLTTDN
ncbi:MAG TPA: four helix bundle protein [Terracidiphilus sp.]|nr:four helix bundle protein [Terracidiphilus sp.]